MLTLAHIQPFYALDQVYAELELEVQVERAKSKHPLTYIGTKASPGAFNQYFLSFILNLALCYS
jgi:hypothetical protein